MGTESRTRNLEYAAYAYGAAALLALVSIALAAVSGIALRSYFAVLMALAGAVCGVLVAWRMWAGDTGFWTGVLAYSSLFGVGLAATVDLVTPVALNLIFGAICGGGRCSSAPLLTDAEQAGYLRAGIAAVLALAATFVGLVLLGSERARRRRN